MVPGAAADRKKSAYAARVRTVALAIALAACHPTATAMTPSTPPPSPPASAPGAGAAPALPPLDETLLADAAATMNWRLGVPTVLAIARDGAVLFRRTPPRGFASDLLEQAPDGTVRVLASAAELLGAGDEHLSDAEKARRERTRTATRGVVDVGLSEDGKIVMVPLGGVFHLIERATGKRTVLDPRGAAYDPHLSPDGQIGRASCRERVSSPV